MLGESNACATIAVKDLAAAMDFYQNTLGLTVEKDTPGGNLLKSGQSYLFVYESEFAGTNKATAATWNTQDIEKVVEDLAAKGVKFEHYDNFPDTKVVGDLHVMGDMKSAWFKDPDGNILNINNGEM
jgi:catechol 2,3-dioxygenase-like lactoylglutathione lyase family enzyme